MARKKKSDDPSDENPEQNGGNDDTFGLPEIEYEPISRESNPEPEVRAPEPEPESSQSRYTEEKPVTDTPMERDEVQQNEHNAPYYDEDESSSPWPKILGIVLLLLVVGAAVWYFGWKRPQDAAALENTRKEEQARMDSTRAEQERAAAEQRRIAEETQRKADSVAHATPAAGTIETLTERTGRYYVVVASAIDGDLLMDYARRLSAKGVNAKIIAPFGNVKFHRLAVAEGESFAAAAQTAETLKGEYTDGTWVIKY